MKHLLKIALISLGVIGVHSIQAADDLSPLPTTTEANAQSKEVFLFPQFFPGSIWNNERNIPEQLNGNGVCMRPLLNGEDASRDLVFDLHSKEENMRGYADGVPRTPERCAAILSRHADRWDKGILHSGFGVFTLSSEGKAETPLGIAGIGLSGKPGVGEIFGFELFNYRNQGFGKQAAGLMRQWAKFIMAANVDVGGQPLDTIIATANLDNFPSHTLMKEMGFKPATEDDFKQFNGTIIIPEGAEYAPAAEVPSDTWKSDKPLPYETLGVMSKSRHEISKALFLIKKSDLLKNPTSDAETPADK